ncbi:MAG: hypothetical protein QOE05_3168 [Actinomycetota bacterium]|jgi:hypothetical protein|nr:hypothetical protein [Actinomycetota bacterium]
MTPIDDELRSLLHNRADGVAPAPDPLSGIERRAKRMRRNQVAAAVAGSALAVAAVAVAVPALVPDRGGKSSVVATAPPSESPSPRATAVPGQPVPEGALDPQQPWDYRGDRAVIAGNELTTLQSEWATAHPGATLTPLYGEVYESSQRPQVTFVSTGGGSDRWGVATSSEAGWTWLHDEPLAFGTKALMAPLPADEAARLLVVAAPTTGQIEYAKDGSSFRPLTGVSPSIAGVAYTSLEGDTSHDAVRVLNGDGDIDHPVFQGPAPDYGGATTAARPQNYLGWPFRGMPVASGLRAAVDSAFAKALGVPVSDAHTAYLYSGMDGTGRTVVLLQGWATGTDARTFLWWGSSDGTGDGVLGKSTDIGPAALVALVPAQGKGVQTLVVVGEPATAHVGYTSTANGAFNTVEGGGAVLIDVSTDSTGEERIRLTDAAGKLLYRDTVQQAVCAAMGCG